MTGFVAKSEALNSSQWEALIVRFDPVVFLSLLAAGIRPLPARELCQDTWSRLYEQWAQGRLDVLRLPGLAIAQARLLACENHRRLTRNTPLNAEALQCPDPLPHLDERVSARQTADSISSVLSECPPRARVLFELVMLHPDVPHRTLAKQAGVSLQRLRQTLCEVRARLRAALDQRESGVRIDAEKGTNPCM